MNVAIDHLRVYMYNVNKAALPTKFMAAWAQNKPTEACEYAILDDRHQLSAPICHQMDGIGIV